VLTLCVRACVALCHGGAILWPGVSVAVPLPTRESQEREGGRGSQRIPSDIPADSAALRRHEALDDMADTQTHKGTPLRC
jgi:hypothetical protein